MKDGLTKCVQVMIPFAMFGFLAPWVAAATMALSSVSVLLNALRLRLAPL